MSRQPSGLLRSHLWDGYFVLAGGATLAFVATADHEPAVARAWATASLFGLALWYVCYGRRLIREEVEDRRSYVYFAGAAVFFVPAVVLVTAASYALLVLCPQAFMLMRTVPAIGVVVAFNVTDVVAAHLDTRDWADTARGPLPVALMVIVGSAAFGSWARQVSAQNEERARLIAQLDGSRAEVARLSHTAGVLAERQRLAGDVHDTVAQGLTSMIMLIQAAAAEMDRDPGQARRHLDLALTSGRDNLAEARALVGALTPTGLAGSSLPEALRRLADRFVKETGVPATFHGAGPVGEVATAVEVVLLRAVQESLANVRRHAGATRVDVRLERVADGLAVAVTDDGCGFVPDQVGGGYGLAGMRARVEQVSGTVQVDSVPGRGTTVKVEVPDR
ncbi:sensor histidine kinase [Micromonospora sp. NPDC000207]|uniref:sensor histidine kinase n=1 Tax=Micromonospora sp. NPDC000207 TaxID=3154246 RepID=UPI003332C8C6